MINRLDSICQAVLKGKWPGVRRAYEGNAVTSFYTTKLLDNAGTLVDDPSASPQGSKVKKHDADREKEFSVKINNVCYFTFSPKMPICNAIAVLGMFCLIWLFFPFLVFKFISLKFLSFDFALFLQLWFPVCSHKDFLSVSVNSFV